MRGLSFGKVMSEITEMTEIAEMTDPSRKDRLAAIRAYVSDAMGCPAEAITVVTRFEDGNRHAVYRVSYRDASDAARDVVVRVSSSGDARDAAQAEHEAAVLKCVGGVAAPELYDFRRTSNWFATPAMCVQFAPGRQLDVRSVDSTQIEQLGSLLAWVHERPTDGLGEPTRTATTIATYADERLRAILQPVTLLGSARWWVER
jgi:hypothetical protein